LAQAILQRIAAGDRTAVQDCLDKYGGLVWSIARKMLRSNEDAEDAVQEIFIDIWKNAERYDDAQSSETTFVAMIARRRLIDRIRSMNRRISADSIEDVTTEPFNRSDENMQLCVEAKEAAAAMKNLRPEQRQVLYLSIGTVKTHARRGILQAREALGLGDIQNTKEVSV